ncbi:MAG: hypothetical protein ACI398_04115 [Clostridium sp.]
MIKYSKDKSKQYEFLRKTGMTSDILSIQDVIDSLHNLNLPKGRTLSNVPFGIMSPKGKTHILYGDSKHNPLLTGIQEAFPVLLNFRENSGIILLNKDELYKKLESLTKENNILKNRLLKIKELTLANHTNNKNA